METWEVYNKPGPSGWRIIATMRATDRLNDEPDTLQISGPNNEQIAIPYPTACAILRHWQAAERRISNVLISQAEEGFNRMEDEIRRAEKGV